MKNKGMNVSDSLSYNTLITTAFQTMMDNTSDMVFVKNSDLVYLAASMPFVKMVGKKKADEIIGHTDLEIFADENLARRYVADDHILMDSQENLIDYMEPITEEDGQARYGSTSKYLLWDDKGNQIGILGITKDITRDYIARRHYQKELKYLFELPEDIFAVSYIDVDGWRVISQRRQLIDERTMQSCHTVQSLVDAALESIVDKNSEVMEFYRNFTSENLNRIYENGRTDFSFKYRRRMTDGVIRWIRNDVRFLIDVYSGHLCVMLLANDIEEEIQKEKHLLEAAQIDKMTMLLNRDATMDRIEEILKRYPEQNHALFMIDVDNFKSLNDTMGHRTGDEFLILLTEKIRNNFLETDIVGRVGGDEFFALMQNVSGVAEITEKAKSLLEVIQGVCAAYAPIPISGSMGISCFPKDGNTLEELYGKADEALYQAKRDGKNRFKFV